MCRLRNSTACKQGPLFTLDMICTQVHAFHKDSSSWLKRGCFSRTTSVFFTTRVRSTSIKMQTSKIPSSGEGHCHFKPNKKIWELKINKKGRFPSIPLHCFLCAAQLRIANDWPKKLKKLGQNFQMGGKGGSTKWEK